MLQWDLKSWSIVQEMMTRLNTASMRRLHFSKTEHSWTTRCREIGVFDAIRVTMLEYWWWCVAHTRLDLTQGMAIMFQFACAINDVTTTCAIEPFQSVAEMQDAMNFVLVTCATYAVVLFHFVIATNCPTWTTSPEFCEFPFKILSEPEHLWTPQLVKASLFFAHVKWFCSCEA